MNPQLLVDCIDVNTHFGALHVLKNVSLTIRPGETVGLVGESGSGKTTLGRAILGIGPVSSGRILFNGTDIAGCPPGARAGEAAAIQAVFQDPYSSLNPSMTIEDILIEPVIARGLASRVDATAQVRKLLKQVALPTDAAQRYPREFSGGQRQRVAIARALALSPRLIVCDEPVSALDLSTQARVLDLFIEIQERTGVAYLFVSHDLSVVRHISHRVAVMRSGEIVEFGECDQVTARPAHDYTRRLLLAAPVADPIRQAERRAAFQALEKGN
ncbi:ATP-binding cassette domain-containing protein [Roseinatronobacter alkalisoli]|uniref:ATP-binding cassette domain-containing protein n=1 Tax=Roseinatronobacter alkalisoli TaxID=3028235 RepID=A0ABT5TDX6_9RHOB|nr:ATP-binding cassette domain-containing protein [Roseinatronobacter sp. HJB301]MDD7973221.1 ATP-binding cassette domain-containing protein [Roseinatronobacter sp. HJB301]